MKWEDLCKQLLEASKGTGKCCFVSIHSIEDGTCLGQLPRDGRQVKPTELIELKNSYRDPTVLYSSGIVLKGIKFTYVKIEGPVMLGRTHNLACLILKTLHVFIVCMYPPDELSKNVLHNCQGIIQRIDQNMGPSKGMKK